MSRRAKLEQMLETNPDDVFLNFGLAMEMVNEGNGDEAVRQFDRVLQLDPAYVTAYFRKSEVLISMGKRPEASTVLTAGLEAAKKAGDSHSVDQMQAILDRME